MSGPALTEPQKTLLLEFQESHTGGLFIDKWGRYWRTAQALEAKGYIKREAIEFTGPQIWFEPVAEDAESPSEQASRV